MKPETLLSIKKQVGKFAKLYDILNEMWNGKLEHGDSATYPETVQVGVILHNIAHNSTNCVGYSHEQAVKDLENYIAVLKAINLYHNKMYMIHYAWNEVEYIYIGETMSEDFEPFDETA